MRPPCLTRGAIAWSVRAQKTTARAPGYPGPLILVGSARLTHLGEAAGDDDGGLHPLQSTLPHDARHGLGRHSYDSQVYLVGNLGNAGVHLEAQDLLLLGVDRVDGAPVAGP